MNQQRRIEDRLSEWFADEAPTEIPDRVLEAAFTRTRAAPQDAVVLGWRVKNMLPRLAVAAAALGVIAAVGVGALGLYRSGSTGPAASQAGLETSTPRSASPTSVMLRFTTDAGVILYPQLAGMEYGRDGLSVGFEGNGGGVAMGILDSAVHPDSLYVVSPDLDRDVGTSVDEFASWLLEHPRLDATGPVERTVAGQRALEVTITLKEGENYAQGTTPSRLGLVSFGGGSAAIGPTNGETDHFILTDFGDRTLVIMWSSAQNEDGFRPTVEEFLEGLVLQPA